MAIDKMLASIDKPSIDALMGCMLIREFVTRLVGVTSCHKYVTFFCCINLIMHCVWAVSLPMCYEKVNCMCNCGILQMEKQHHGNVAKNMALEAQSKNISCRC